MVKLLCKSLYESGLDKDKDKYAIVGEYELGRNESIFDNGNINYRQYEEILKSNGARYSSTYGVGYYFNNIEDAERAITMLNLLI